MRQRKIKKRDGGRRGILGFEGRGAYYFGEGGRLRGLGKSARQPRGEGTPPCR